MKKWLSKLFGISPVVYVNINIDLQECDIKIIVDSEKVNYEEPKEDKIDDRVV